MSKKLLGVGVTLALVASVLVGGTSAAAQSVSCANIDAMLSVLGVTGATQVAQAKAALGCTSMMAPAYTFTRDLTVGSTGADVTALQTKLGVTPATGYFGPITKAAVAKYQVDNGIVNPGTGYVGQLTRAKLNYVAPVVVAPVTPVTPATPSNNLDGTDGTISDVSKLSSYNNEEVGEGESNVKVAGFEIEASKDGDIQIKSVKLMFTEDGNGSDNLDDYIESVSVYVGSTKVGSADVSDFNEESTNGVWTKTISLTNVIVRSDEVVKFYVAIDAVNTFDSGDISGTDWTVDLENVRFIDGSGVTTTEDAEGDIGSIDAPIDFVTFSTAADTELKISLDSSSPDASVVLVDENDSTDNVVLLKGKIKVEGTSDVVIDELPITLTNSSSTAGVSSIAGNLILTIDGEDYSESVTATSSTATTTFNNLDLTLDAGKTYSFTIAADINNIDDVTFEEGDSLTASLTSSNRNLIDAENSEGDQLSDSSEKSGTALGEAQTFYTSGIMVDITSASGVITSNDGVANDSVTYTVNLTIEAFGDPVYISHATTTDSTYVYTGTAPTVNESRLAAKDTDTQDDGDYNYFFLSDGDSRDFTYTLILTATSTASTISNFKLSDIGWGLTPNVVESYGGDLDDSAVSGSKLIN